MFIKVHDSKEQLQVKESCFNYPYNEDLIHQTTVWELNNERSGNSAQKTRAEVRGGGAKPWRQKGTGRARAGTIRSPLWRTGGRAFANKKRDYSQKLNKKMYLGAMKSILSELIRLDRLYVLKHFECKSNKTRELKKYFDSLKLKSGLLIVEQITEELYFASRNLYHYEVATPENITSYQLLKYENIMITENAVKKIEEVLS